MKTDNIGRVTMNTDEAITALLRGSKIDNWVIDDKNELTQFINREDYLNGKDHLNSEYPYVNEEEFHHNRQETWFIDEKYKNLDIEQYLLDKCKTDIEINRVVEELMLFKQKGLYPILRLMVFLIETKDKKDLWGVGRGSSVASYCLYLIGVHKIDSIKYDLDISEFLK